MGQHVIKICLVVAGIINLLPLIGVLSAGKLEKLYGLPITEPNLEILMRHRAVLFGIVGAFLIGSIFKTEWQTPAIAAGLISMAAFIFLTFSVTGYTGAFRHIVIADIIGIAALIVAVALVRKS